MTPAKVKKLNDLEVLKKLFNAVTEDDILTTKDNTLYYKGQPLSAEVKAQLISDANLLQTITLFPMLLDCMRYEANKLIYEKAVDGDSLIFPKAVLFAVKILSEKVKNLSVLK